MDGAARCTVVVEIMGQEYRVEGEGDPEKIAAMARYVDRKMRELSSETNPIPATRMGVLAALNIVEELFREREDRQRWEGEVEARLRSLAARLKAETD